MAFSDRNAIFIPYFELEAIARQSVEVSREVICAYFGNMGRNRYFLLLIFWVAILLLECVYLEQSMAD